MVLFAGIASESHMTQIKIIKCLGFNCPVILDIEGFRCFKNSLIKKNFPVCSDNTIDTSRFLP